MMNTAGYRKIENQLLKNSGTNKINVIKIPEPSQKHEGFIKNKVPNHCFGNDGAESSGLLHPLSTGWSPFGANYDNTQALETDKCMHSDCEFLPPNILHSNKKVSSCKEFFDLERTRSMEDEKELLTSSLLSLTSQFAHIQLRVRQIVEAPSNQRDDLLKDLEAFAFQGIPEPTYISFGISNTSDNTSEIYTEGAQKSQFELIDNLKKQLTYIESIAFHSGAPILPQHILLEKQRIIIDELRRKLNLKVKETDLPLLTSEDLRNQVDNAFGEFVGPLKMKEQLVTQLKTQICDLERFIAFLQCDSFDSKLKTLNDNGKSNDAYNSYAAKKSSSLWQKDSKENTKMRINITERTDHKPITTGSATPISSKLAESLNSKGYGIVDKVSILLQMVATFHFSHKSDFKRNCLKKTFKGNHWGDLRAQLEVDIQEIASLAATLSFDREKLGSIQKIMPNNLQDKQQRQTFLPNNIAGTLKKDESIAATLQREISSDSEVGTDFYDWKKNRKQVANDTRNIGDSTCLINKELTSAVRKNFAVTLQRLMQHGLCSQSKSTSGIMVPFIKCFYPSQRSSAYPSKSSSVIQSSSVYLSSRDNSIENFNRRNESDSYYRPSGQQMHAWELVMEYYYLKNGVGYNNTPARKLSQSFNLNIAGLEAVSINQSLLGAIAMIVALHRPYKRSYNSYFKAFVCVGLNSQQLVEWLNLIFSCKELVKIYYTPESYAAQTAFRDSLHSIKILLKYEFDLPVDLAVKHFRKM